MELQRSCERSLQGPYKNKGVGPRPGLQWRHWERSTPPQGQGPWWFSWFSLVFIGFPWFLLVFIGFPWFSESVVLYNFLVFLGFQSLWFSTSGSLDSSLTVG